MQTPVPLILLTGYVQLLQYQVRSDACPLVRRRDDSNVRSARAGTFLLT